MIDPASTHSVSTSEHLAAVVTGRARTASDRAKIPGVGQSRIDKHGAVAQVDEVPL